MYTEYRPALSLMLFVSRKHFHFGENTYVRTFTHTLQVTSKRCEHVSTYPSVFPLNWEKRLVCSVHTAANCRKNSVLHTLGISRHLRLILFCYASFSFLSANGLYFYINNFENLNSEKWNIFCININFSGC